MAIDVEFGMRRISTLGKNNKISNKAEEGKAKIGLEVIRNLEPSEVTLMKDSFEVLTTNLLLLLLLPPLLLLLLPLPASPLALFLLLVLFPFASLPSL